MKKHSCKKHVLALCCGGLLWSLGATAQFVVDRTKYPDYSAAVRPDMSLLRPTAAAARAAATEGAVRPDHCNNAETRHFPPAFNQDGGSCGSASRIAYMLTHELNSLRDADGSLPENQYPTHFVWLLTNGNSGKDEFVTAVGVPNATTYGGRTYSSLFGNQVETNDNFGWMTGYDKWYSAMFNRALQPAHLPYTLGTTAGRELLKNWLWNHNGDADFHSGGVVGIGVASGGDWQRIAQTEANDAAGVTGMYYVKRWGTQVDHALTIVGYDDRIEFDLNGNGVYGEASADERGAWIVANSWGSGWCNGGFIYCPYAYAGSYFRSSTDASGATVYEFSKDWWAPEIYHVRKNYRPLRTLRIRMDYSRRSELSLRVGVAADINADAPERTVQMEHFNYAGDGHNGETNPAPEVPMLGRWADGKLHDEPMEFGYDLTDLTEGFDRSAPLKYFFIIDRKKNSRLGAGHVYDLSVIDYETSDAGIAVPFALGAGGQAFAVEAGGDDHIVLSTVVSGSSGLYAPSNAAIAGTTLSWSAPAVSHRQLTGYRVYCGDDLVASLPATAQRLDLDGQQGTAFAVAALYGQDESARSNTAVAPAAKHVFGTRMLSASGFTIPGILAESLPQATIEYAIKPASLSDGSQKVGPGFGAFGIQAYADGRLVTGWEETAGSYLTSKNALKPGEWSYVSVVVNKATLQVYVNGQLTGTVRSTAHTGLPALGDLVFGDTQGAAGSSALLDAEIGEVRIWSKARSRTDIVADCNRPLTKYASDDALLAYYRMDVTPDGKRLVDAKGRFDAPLHTPDASAPGGRQLADAFTLTQSGFTISGLFDGVYDKATLEYWIKPASLTNWNQQIGPGWGKFMLHANSDASLTFGWNTTTQSVGGTSRPNRVSTAAGALSTGKWQHVALVVDGATMTLFLNGEQAASLTSAQYSGLGGFGDLTFGTAGANGMHGDLAEVRVYGTARTADEVRSDMNTTYGSAATLPAGILAYYPGTVFAQGSRNYLRDYAGSRHAALLSTAFKAPATAGGPLLDFGEGGALAVNLPAAPVTAGEPLVLSATTPANADALEWTLPGLAEPLRVVRPQTVFVSAGPQTVGVKAFDAFGSLIGTAEATLDVQPLTVDFAASAAEAGVDETVSFVAASQAMGYRSRWEIEQPEGRTLTPEGPVASATFGEAGTYKVRLTVSTASGETVGAAEKTVEVHSMPPVADFGISSAVVVKGSPVTMTDASRCLPTQWKWTVEGTNYLKLFETPNVTFTPAVPGRFDVTLAVANGAGSDTARRVAGLTVCNEDSGNGLNFTAEQNRITTQASPLTACDEFTIDWWMNPSQLKTNCLGMGEGESTLKLQANLAGSLKLCLKGTTQSSENGYVLSGGWHHYAVTVNTASGLVRFYRDGQFRSQRSLASGASLKGLTVERFSIGGFDDAPLYGSIDEFRVWASALSDARVAEVSNKSLQGAELAEAQTEAGGRLRLYYQFNQSGGAEVTDATANRNNAVREGFGPDGDAWSASLGVFSLAPMEDTREYADVTSRYLVNTQAPFAANSDATVNTTDAARFLALNDWKTAGAVRTELSDGGFTIAGAHVDEKKDGCLTITSGWDSFASILQNHKVYQVVTLPAGVYKFTAYYGDYEGQFSAASLAVAADTVLPDISKLSSQALASQTLRAKSDDCMSNTLTFTLLEETQVALGLVATLTSDRCLTIERFELTCHDVKEAVPYSYNLAIGSTGISTLYLPAATAIPEGLYAYRAESVGTDGRLTLSRLTDGVVPAEYGVLVCSGVGAGTFTFNETDDDGSRPANLFKGSLVEKDRESHTRYLMLGSRNGDMGFFDYAGEKILPYRAYLEVLGSRPVPGYTIELGTLEGIDTIRLDADADIYDLSGRRVERPGKGVYIVGGRKVLVK